MHKYEKRKVKEMIKVLNKSGQLEIVCLSDKQKAGTFPINSDINRKSEGNPLQKWRQIHQ